ncbi:MAG: GH116 family glycosyl hydrolase [Ignavibacteriales bacterium]|nr:GH116 family glycosyl hydrolase [Ignavibacteriales bacterium]
MKKFLISILLLIQTSNFQAQSEKNTTGSIPKFNLKENDLLISRIAQPHQYFDKIGQKAALMGFENGMFEMWVWPWKPLRNFELRFFTNNSTQAILAKDIVRTIDATPEATTITYTYESFTVKEIFIVPVKDPGLIILLDIHTVEPITIVPGFLPVMQPQWPAGIGGQYSYWDDDVKAFVISESQRRAIFLCGSPAGKEMSAPPAHMFADNPLQFKIDVKPNETREKYIPIIIAGGINTKMDSVKTLFTNLSQNAEQYYFANYNYYQDLRNSTTQIITPDKSFNSAYEWGKVALRNLLVDNPTLGKGLVAGYGLSGSGGRPGFAWFFGGDAFANSLAFNSFGDFNTVREALEFTQKWQRQENFPIRKKSGDEINRDVGKMSHELSQSDGLVDWWNDYHFGYNHADTSPWYIVAMGDYFHKSGDIDFIKESWNSIKQAYTWCLGKDSNNDGLMDLKNSGLGVLEFGSLVKIYNDMYTQALWTQSIKEVINMAGYVGDKEMEKSASSLLVKAKESLEKLFWMDDLGFYSFGANETGVQVKEKNPYPSIAFDFELMDKSRTEKSLEAFAHSDLLTDWGIRSLSSSSKFYDPRNYNYGAVWPFNSIMLGTALYKYNYNLAGFANLQSTLQHQSNYGIGVIPEVFSGDMNQKLGEAYHDQGFSTSGFMVPFLRGLTGLEVDALNMKVIFKPQLPANWDSLIINNIKVRDENLNLKFFKSSTEIRLLINKKGDSKINFEFTPVLQTGAQIINVQLNDKQIVYSVINDKKVFQPKIEFTCTNNDVVTIKLIPVPEIFLLPLKSKIGDENHSLKFISQNKEGNKIHFKVEGITGEKYEVGLTNQQLVGKIAGAKLKDGKMIVEIEPSDKKDFAEHEIIIETKQNEQFVIPVVVVKYFPVDGKNIDKKATGDWGVSLEFTRTKTDSITKEVITALEEGSRYHGYKDSSSKPSLQYKVLKTYEFLEPLPTVSKPYSKEPMTDYYEIMKRIDAKKWVEENGIKEFWLWGYHGGVVGLWESNMAGPYGDVSNSNRDENDLPVLNKTYTVYHYNYQRGTSEAVEDHMHQTEAVLNYIDGRDTTDEDSWGDLLFWGKFVGSDISHKIINPHCGWAHYPPNAIKDYDWKNTNFVQTDIEDWNPEGTGKKITINCNRWECNSLKWFVYWMQNIPGANNGIKYNDKKLNNWWQFIGDFDNSQKNKIKLVE